MSKTSGDKARAHRIRKQNIARRIKVRELQALLRAKALKAAA